MGGNFGSITAKKKRKILKMVRTWGNRNIRSESGLEKVVIMTVKRIWLKINKSFSD
jgi:hypothetical protein